MKLSQAEIDALFAQQAQSEGAGQAAGAETPVPATPEPQVDAPQAAVPQAAAPQAAVPQYAASQFAASQVAAADGAVAASFPRLEVGEPQPAYPAREPAVPSLGLFAAVELDVTVRLGQTQRSIRDLMNLGPGAVLELNRLAGETVDILVNGRLLAKGEVVVVGENFGVRVAELVRHTEGKSA